jgi:N-acetylneuraminic acid mutarotase
MMMEKRIMSEINTFVRIRIRISLTLVILFISFLALLASCGVEQTTPPAGISVTLIPNTAQVHVLQSVQFTAYVYNSTNGAITWSLSVSGCSGAACGTISSIGTYIAPASVPSPATVTVKATSAADTSKSAIAVITILEAVVVPDQWTWVSGSKEVGQGSVYGTQGAADPSNLPGGRESPVSWIDSSGKLWLFGGIGLGLRLGHLNDLWKYDPATDEWTWVSGSNDVEQAGVYGSRGIADPANVPGARQSSVSWIDSSGMLWLFGGHGYDSVGESMFLNDLWKYDPTTNEWTWVSGSKFKDQVSVYGTRGIAAPSNVPGSRWQSASWIDSDGTLWLFGGRGWDSDFNVFELNDLWKYAPTADEWTWVSGTISAFQTGIYGLQGIAAPSNVPGGRHSPVSWIDPSGDLWLFGGYGYDSAGNRGALNDLWKYNQTTDEWTWVSGGNIVDQKGVYSTWRAASPLNIPGSRWSSGSWIDASGNLWLFGGIGQDWSGRPGIYQRLNELWMYDLNAKAWSWESGRTLGDQAGEYYSTQHTPDPSSIPGGRGRFVSWTDSNGRFWLFGGGGYDWRYIFGFLNDLWYYGR